LPPALKLQEVNLGTDRVNCNHGQMASVKPEVESAFQSPTPTKECLKSEGFNVVQESKHGGSLVESRVAPRSSNHTTILEPRS
ncbi:hypothetical protein AVEN_35920-1, partial [Araneus ventricosus]